MLLGFLTELPCYNGFLWYMHMDMSVVMGETLVAGHVKLHENIDTGKQLYVCISVNLL